MTGKHSTQPSSDVPHFLLIVNYKCMCSKEDIYGVKNIKILENSFKLKEISQKIETNKTL